jgi:hypothetical protein
MTHLPIWSIGKIPADVCDAASKEFQLIEPRDASMGIDGDKIEHKTRDTTVRFAPDNHWFGGILFEHAMKANRQCGWNYDIDSHEAVQYAEYGPEQHYHWHTDTFTLSGSPIERKVTAVCLMNDPSEFEGGEFQVQLYQDYTATLEKGTIIAFPSILYHRVTPIISGKRISATIWLNGPRFK